MGNGGQGVSDREAGVATVTGFPINYAFDDFVGDRPRHPGAKSAAFFVYLSDNGGRNYLRRRDTFFSCATILMVQ